MRSLFCEAKRHQRSHITDCKTAKNMCFSELICEAEKAHKKLYQIPLQNGLAKPCLAWRKRFDSVYYLKILSTTAERASEIAASRTAV